MAHRTRVFGLYRNINRLHRQLPTEMRTLGNSYVKNEFSLHKNAEPRLASNFLNKWETYSDVLSRQLGSNETSIGKDIDSDLMARLDEERRQKLRLLETEARHLFSPPTETPSHVM